MSILSIAIPTYNRQEKLEKCLLRICAQILKEGMQDQVEVLVSDNASTDDTATFLRSFHFSRVTVEMLYQPENLGFDGNVHALYIACKSQYIWYFADDDVLLDGAIAKVLGSIRNSLPDVVMFSFDQPPGSGTRHFDYEHSVYVSKNLVEQAELVFRQPKITAYVLKLVKFDDNALNQMAPFLGTNFYFIALSYSILQASSQSRVAIISEFLAQSDDDYNVIRFGPDTWFAAADVLRHSFFNENAFAYARRKERELYYAAIQAIWAANIGVWVVEEEAGYHRAASKVKIKPIWLFRNPRKALQLLLMLVGSKRLLVLAVKLARFSPW